MEREQVAIVGTTDRGFEETVERCRQALGEEGFGVLTEIDLRATLKKKLDVEIEPHTILGACHPESAYRALTAAPEVGVLLPCNVAVAREGDETVVRAMNPQSALTLVDHPEVAAVADEVGRALRRAVDAATG